MSLVHTTILRRVQRYAPEFVKRWNRFGTPTGIDFVAPGVEWSGADHPPEDSLYLWGPDVPAYFIENTEVVR